MKTNARKHFNLYEYKNNSKTVKQIALFLVAVLVITCVIGYARSLEGLPVLCIIHIPILGVLFFIDVRIQKKMKDIQFEQYFIKLQERKKSIQIAKIRNGVSYEDCDDIIMPDEKIKLPIIYYSVLVLACVLAMGMTI